VKVDERVSNFGVAWALGRVRYAVAVATAIGHHPAVIDVDELITDSGNSGRIKHIGVGPTVLSMTAHPMRSGGSIPQSGLPQTTRRLPASSPASVRLGSGEVAATAFARVCRCSKLTQPVIEWPCYRSWSWQKRLSYAKLLVYPHVNILPRHSKLVDHEVMHDTCLCGHDRIAHDHYRGGTDCASCVGRHCRSFRSDTVTGRLMDRLTGGRSRSSADADSFVGAVSAVDRLA
jgi:hypothetical protein